MRLALLIAPLLALSCATTPPIDAVPYNMIAPVLDRTSLLPVESLGYEIYLRDIAASRATDAALEVTDLQGAGSRGWIVVPHKQGYLVRFVDGTEHAIADVSVDPHSMLPPYVMIHSPRPSLDPNELRMWHALQLASQEPYSACSDRYNSIVVPATDASDSDWFVYLIAATLEPTTILLGGHHRFRIDHEGESVVEHRLLSKSCARLTDYRDVLQVITVSHIVSDEPTEVHVYLNHLHGIPIGVLVVDTGKLYMLEQGKIRLIEDRYPIPPAGDESPAREFERVQPTFKPHDKDR